MNTILGSIDFSDSSFNAANYAGDLAAAIQGNLVLTNVVRFPAAAAEAAVSKEMYDDMLSLAKHDLDIVAGKLADRLNHAVSISTEVMAGTVDYQIEVIAGKYKPFAIVMGIRPGRSFERLLLGSHALFTLRYSQFPVLIVPQDCHFKGIRNIGLATDLNHLNSNTIDSIRRHVSAFNASLHVVHICRNAGKVVSQEAKDPISLANQLSSFKPKFHFVENEEISEGLREFSKHHNLDLLIIIPKEHGLLDLFSEKHSGRIVTHMDIPVLAIPSQSA